MPPIHSHRSHPQHKHHSPPKNVTPQQLAQQSLQLLNQLQTAVMTAITTNNNYMNQVATGGAGNIPIAMKVNTQLMEIFQKIQTDIISNQNGSGGALPTTNPPAGVPATPTVVPATPAKPATPAVPTTPTAPTAPAAPAAVPTKPT